MGRPPLLYVICLTTFVIPPCIAVVRLQHGVEQTRWSRETFYEDLQRLVAAEQIDAAKQLLAQVDLDKQIIFDGEGFCGVYEDVQCYPNSPRPFPDENHRMLPYTIWAEIQDPIREFAEKYNARAAQIR